MASQPSRTYQAAQWWLLNLARCNAYHRSIPYECRILHIGHLLHNMKTLGAF